MFQILQRAGLLALLGLAGCAAPPPATPEPSPTPAVATSTPTAPPPTDTPEPTATASPTAEATGESPYATLDPTAAAGLPPTSPPHAEIPDAPIRILRPGNLSRVTSPFRLVVDVPPGPDGRVQADLVGEDGRLLARKVFTLATPPGSDRNTAVLDFEFEIRGGFVAEAGRIEVSVLDEFGRLKYLASHDLILLAAGRADIRFPVTQSDRLYIEQPGAGGSAYAGALLVSGRIRDLGGEPLVIELVDEGGRILATGLAAVQAGAAGEYGLFVGEVLYSVSAPTPVRLTVRARGLRIPGNAYVSSVVVMLNP
jgi:hypothetical protein